MNQIDAGQRCIGKPSNQVGGVIEMQADVTQADSFDRGQRFGHAVDEGLNADKARARLFARLSDHRLTAAETDFEGHIGDRHLKQLSKVCRRWARKVERQQRQEGLDQVRLVWAQLVAFAAAKERAG